jgi:Cys-tRNA(Pro)/Cys-tRNA(Cys) deacylase
MAVRNNVTRLLDSRAIAYELVEYAPEKLSAEETAAVLGVPAEHVYKSLVILREGKSGKPLIVLAPGGRDVNLKKLAASVGEKKLRMASQAEAEALTHLQVGGISALALINKGFEICLDRAALGLPRIHVSAGQRGANVGMQVKDLLELTDARLVDTV